MAVLTQWPPVHESVVQLLSSSHVPVDEQGIAQAATVLCSHQPPVHLSAVHGFVSSQSWSAAHVSVQWSRSRFAQAYSPSCKFSVQLSLSAHPSPPNWMGHFLLSLWWTHSPMRQRLARHLDPVWQSAELAQPQ
jgi:hypothetical protein